MLISCIKQIRSFISLRLLCPFSSSSSSSSFFRAVLGHIQKKVFNAKTQFTDGRKTQRKTFLLNRKHLFFYLSTNHQQCSFHCLCLSNELRL